LHTDAFHTSLALIDLLAPVVPRIAPHDPALAHSLRSAASAIPQHIAAGRHGRAHASAIRVHVLLLVAQAWGYVHTATLAQAQHTARHLQALTAQA
jgi:hypothetical protein